MAGGWVPYDTLEAPAHAGAEEFGATIILPRPGYQRTAGRLAVGLKAFTARVCAHDCARALAFGENLGCTKVSTAAMAGGWVPYGDTLACWTVVITGTVCNSCSWFAIHNVSCVDHPITTHLPYSSPLLRRVRSLDALVTNNHTNKWVSCTD